MKACPRSTWQMWLTVEPPEGRREDTNESRHDRKDKVQHLGLPGTPKRAGSTGAVRETPGVAICGITINPRNLLAK